MKTLFYAVTAMTVSVLSLSCSRTDSVDENSEIRQKLDFMADSILQKTGLPGMVVGVWAPKKHLEYLEGKGVADMITKNPVKSDFNFRAGSLTKTFTVTLILQLVDENKLMLDDHLSKFFPDFPNAEIISVRNLANMTSGIPEYTATQEFGSILSGDPLHQWQPEELIALVKDRPLLFQPGTKGYYSNSNTVLLGMIITKITGKTLAENYNSRILNPLKLTRTVFPINNLMPFNYMKGYETDQTPGVYDFDVSEFFDPSYAGAAGAMISNVGNLKTWVESLVGGKMISAGLHSQRFAGLPIAEKHATIYGLGMLTFGDGYWGHTGELFGYSTVMMHNQETGATIVIAYNYQNPQNLPDDFYRKIVRILK
ncbi:serine hydrolase [Chryseobacterium koreense]|uniref:serine hydrolase domain-containing protein n=1 Tax=Chryseobacterium koreense TaxID=232216 RepID=UPI0026F01F2F|nr:serine hydrolase domain-containing protein [Chryseobacterium koreense]